MRASSCTADAAVVELDWAQSLCTINGVLHGGVIMALADSAAGVCAYLNLPVDALGTSTIESKTNFVRAVTAGTVTATATPLHRGTTTVVVETRVEDSTGRLVAKVTQTQAVLRQRS
ncbi:MAG: hypothetical protein NVS3B21_10920 [Acidimicrobiales bacterium]